MKNNKKVLFYSSVKDKSLFKIQQFYQIDISILDSLGYSVYTSNSISDAFFFWRYDFVFAYFYRYSLFVAFVAFLFGKRTYFTGGIDSLDRYISKGRSYQIQKYFFICCYLLSKKCIIVSRADWNNVKNVLGKRDAKLVYSEHTIDVSLFNGDIKKEKSFITIGWQGTVGNVQRKGIDIALRIFKKLKETVFFEDYIFYIVGKEGCGTPYIKKLIDEYGLTNAVILTGAISEKDKIQLLCRSKYYMQLSRYEGFGVAALEALCAKNIVIHSGKGGLANRIYRYGIKFDIDQEFNLSYADLQKSLSYFNCKNLDMAVNEIRAYYSNERRKSDFEIFLA